jgi:hypothetical protein
VLPFSEQVKGRVIVVFGGSAVRHFGSQ